MNYNLRLGAVSQGTLWAERLATVAYVGDSEYVPQDFVDDYWRGTLTQRYNAIPGSCKTPAPEDLLDAAIDAYLTKRPDAVEKARLWAERTRR